MRQKKFEKIENNSDFTCSGSFSEINTDLELTVSGIVF